MGSNQSFNLIDEAFVPTNNGLSSLRECFRQGVTFAGGALENITMIGIVSAIVTRACTFQNEEDIADRIDDLETIRNQVDTYLDQWHHKFDFKGKIPFGQSFSLKEGKKFPLTYLDMLSTFGGGQGIVREHQLAKLDTDAEIVMGFLVYQAFAINGKGKVDNNLTAMESIGAKHNFFNARGERYRMFTSDGNHRSVMGPALGTQSGLLHSHILGRDILETAVLNALTYDTPHKMGLPYWEVDHIREDHPDLVDTKIGVLVPLSRLVHFADDGLYITMGVPNEHVIDSATRFILPAKGDKEEGIGYLSVKKDFALWTRLPEILIGFNSQERCPSITRARSRFGDSREMLGATLHIGGAEAASSSGEVFKIANAMSMTLDIKSFTTNEIGSLISNVEHVVKKIEVVASAVNNSEIIYGRIVNKLKLPKNKPDNQIHNFENHIEKSDTKYLTAKGDFLTQVDSLVALGFEKGWEAIREDVIRLGIQALCRSCVGGMGPQLYALVKAEKNYWAKVGLT
jgi:hypothetical protein